MALQYDIGTLGSKPDAKLDDVFEAKFQKKFRMLDEI